MAAPEAGFWQRRGLFGLYELLQSWWRHRVSFVISVLVTLLALSLHVFTFFFQAEDGIRDVAVTGVQTCALPICRERPLCRVISSSSSGSAKRALTASKRSSSALVSATPSMTFSSAVLAGSSTGSCGRKPTEAPSATHDSPPASVSSPAMMRRSVDLPEPLRPRTPILAPGKKDSQTLSSTLRPPG